MDTAVSDLPSISVTELAVCWASAERPWLFDLRRDAAYEASDVRIASAHRMSVDQILGQRDRLPPGRAVIVYCVHGHEVSQQAARALRAQGIDAHFLAGGIEAWRAHGGATQTRASGKLPSITLHQPSRWITRERPKIDRIACPWLIRRFIDPNAQFDYVPADRVLAQAQVLTATPYDVPGVQFTHRGEFCSFDAFISDFGLRDAALDRVAEVVRAADTGQPERSPEASGLLAMSLGLSAQFADDHQMLAAGLPMYDALYAWTRSAQGEVHNAALFEHAAVAKAQP